MAARKKKRKSPKRVKAGKKAAATRRRNKAKRSHGRSRAKRRTTRKCRTHKCAARKGAKTRARNKAKRRASARRSAAKRKRNHPKRKRAATRHAAKRKAHKPTKRKAGKRKGAKRKPAAKRKLKPLKVVRAGQPGYEAYLLRKEARRQRRQNQIDAKKVRREIVKANKRKMSELRYQRAANKRAAKYLKKYGEYGPQPRVSGVDTYGYLGTGGGSSGANAPEGFY